MFSRIFTVTVVTVTEEDHFSALDRQGRDTYETLYLELVLNPHILILKGFASSEASRSILVLDLLLNLCAKTTGLLPT
jgi:hypothetical protein